jgi:hypothetical protein
MQDADLAKWKEQIRMFCAEAKTLGTIATSRQ